MGEMKCMLAILLVFAAFALETVVGGMDRRKLGVAEAALAELRDSQKCSSHTKDD